MAKSGVVRYAIAGFVSLTVLFLMLQYVFSVQDYPSMTESKAMLQSVNTTLVHSIYGAPAVFNSSITCTSSNYTYSGTTVTLLIGAKCVNATYSIQYNYNVSKTIMGVDFSFMIIIGLIILVIIVVLPYLDTANKR